jgi:hypothetical protein
MTEASKEQLRAVAAAALGKVEQHLQQKKRGDLAQALAVLQKDARAAIDGRPATETVTEKRVLKLVRECQSAVDSTVQAPLNDLAAVFVSGNPKPQPRPAPLMR